MKADVGRRYSRGAMIFHWLIAVLVIMNWRIAEAAEHADGAMKGVIFNYHKAWGIVILVLTVGRLLWRWTHPVPPLSPGLRGWEVALARTVHALFYVLLIALPLGGWLANSLGGREIDFFGMFTIPALPVGENKDLGGEIFDLHELGAKFLLALVALHIVGALKHTLIDRDGTLFRMLPFGRAER